MYSLFWPLIAVHSNYKYHVNSVHSYTFEKLHNDCSTLLQMLSVWQGDVVPGYSSHEELCRWQWVDERILAQFLHGWVNTISRRLPLVSLFTYTTKTPAIYPGGIALIFIIHLCSENHLVYSWYMSIINTTILVLCWAVGLCYTWFQQGVTPA